MKKTYMIAGVSLIVVVILILVFVNGNERTIDITFKSLFKGVFIGFIGLIISSFRSTEKKYYDYLEANFKVFIPKYKAYEEGIKLLYSKKIEESYSFFQEVNLENPTLVASYHISVLNIFRKENISSSIEILEQMIAEKDVSKNFGDLYFALAKAYGQIGNESKGKYYSDIAKKKARKLFP